MSVGQGAVTTPETYLAVARESTFGTYATCTSQLCFLSNSFKTVQDTKVLEQVCRSRTYAQNLRLGKTIEGEIEFYYKPDEDAANWIVQNAFGATVSSATATGETTGGTAFEHTFSVGDMNDTYKSLSFNVRKGDGTVGKVFEYHGVRINELSFISEMDEALKCSIACIAKDSTASGNDVSSSLTATASDVLSFTNGRFSVESSFASLTSSSFWHVQNINFKMINNLKSDNESRRIGSDTLALLPPGVATFELSASIRFDTTTAYDAMINHTQFAAEFEFQGDTISGSNIKEGIKLRFPKVYIKDAGEPEIGGPDEILVSEVTFDVLRDNSSSGGYALQAIVTNDTSDYA